MLAAETRALAERLCRDGLSNKQIAERVRCSDSTVANIRKAAGIENFKCRGPRRYHNQPPPNRENDPAIALWLAERAKRAGSPKYKWQPHISCRTKRPL